MLETKWGIVPLLNAFAKTVKKDFCKLVSLGREVIAFGQG